MSPCQLCLHIHKESKATPQPVMNGFSVNWGLSPLTPGSPRSVYTCAIYQSPLSPPFQAIPVPFPSGTGGVFVYQEV